MNIIQYFNKPYEEGARGPESFDCLGLLQDIYRQRGIVLPDWDRPESSKDNAQAISEGANQWERIDSPEQWAAVAIAINGKTVSHVGIMIDQSRFMHTTKETGVCVELIKSPLWEKRIKGFYRWPKRS